MTDNRGETVYLGPQMQQEILAALSGDEILQSNSLATVATKCVVIRNISGRSQSIISLAGISSLTTIRSSHPGLLVVAAGLFLVAAAAHYSKDGASTDLPLAFVGLGFVVAYVGSRRASLVFTVGADNVQTVFGGSSQAASLVRTIKLAQTNLERYSPEVSQLAS